jgi:hypothetical protein
VPRPAALAAPPPPPAAAAGTAAAVAAAGGGGSGASLLAASVADEIAEAAAAAAAAPPAPEIEPPDWRCEPGGNADMLRVCGHMSEVRAGEEKKKTCARASASHILRANHRF